MVNRALLGAQAAPVSVRPQALVAVRKVTVANAYVMQSSHVGEHVLEIVAARVSAAGAGVRHLPELACVREVCRKKRLSSKGFTIVSYREVCTLSYNRLAAS